MKRLRESGVEFERVDYTKTPFTRSKLSALLKKVRLEPAEVLRKKEAAYKKLGLDLPGVTKTKILDAMMEHPELIQRPIVEKGPRAVLARPVDAIDEFLK